MAKNGKIRDEHENGAVKSRTQVYNPATGNFIMRDSSSGKFINVKSDGKPFKGVAKEVRITKVGIRLPKLIAKKAEQSVIEVINRKSK